MIIPLDLDQITKDLGLHDSIILYTQQMLGIVRNSDMLLWSPMEIIIQECVQDIGYLTLARSD